jgi:type IV secretion system protein VirD4
MKRLLWLATGLLAMLMSMGSFPNASGVSMLLGLAAFGCFALALLSRGGAAVVAPLAGARWADAGDTAEFRRPGPFLLGHLPVSGTPLYLTEEQLSGHVMVLGPSRSGKTAGAIAPNVLIRDPAGESLVVLDVKTGPRSLWNVTAGRYGQRARLFCPLYEGSVRYNPLEEIDSIGAAQRKASLLVHNTTPRDLSGDARVYASAAADLAALLFLHVQQDRPQGHTVGSVLRILMGGPGVVRDTLRSSRIAEVRERAGIFAARERKIQEAAVTGLLQRLSPWADPLVDEATSGHWDLRTLGQEPTALYILLPEPDAGRLQPLFAWLLADLLDELIETADRIGLRCPVRIFLDEFRRFGYLAGLGERLPTLRERGVSVLLGVQVISQIEEVYGYREARTLMGNAETKLIFRAGDLETAQMVSTWLGQTSVPAVSVTVGGRGYRSTTVRPHIRPLAPVEEISRIPDGAVIAMSGAARPMALRQARYFESPGFVVVPPPFPLRRRQAAGLSIQPQAAPVRGRRVPPPRPAGGVFG